MPRAPQKSWKRDAVKRFYMAHPDASINQVARELKFGVRTVARAREELVSSGMLAAGRSVTFSTLPSSTPTPETISEEPVAPKKITAGSMLDAEALQQLSTFADSVADEDDDDLTRKNMLREVKRIAFDLTLHPDTRMTATQVWLKLRDMTKGRDLGPGKPMTRDDAKARLIDLVRAVGPELIIAAMYEAFNVEAPVEQAPTNETKPTLGTPEDANPPEHPSNPPQAEDMRPIDMGEVGGDTGTGTAPAEGHQDLPGPPA